MAETREYSSLRELVPQLVLAVQPNLLKLELDLFAKGIITDEQKDELRNQSTSKANKAADLVFMVLDKVKLDPANFKVFIDVLKSNGDPDIDNLIAQIELKPPNMPRSKRLSIAPEVNEQIPLSTSTMIQTRLNAHSTNQVQQTLELECNCQFCMRVLIDKRLSMVAINFPMLNLDDRGNEDDKFQLRIETKTLMMQFHGVESGLFNTVCDKPIPIGRLKFHLNAIKASRCEESIFSDYDDKLQEATEVHTVLNIASKFWSFLDYSLLQHLIQFLGSEDDKKRMEEYCKNFNEYAKRRIKACPSIEPNSDGKWEKVYIKLDSKLEMEAITNPKTINELQEFRFKICEILGIPVAAIHFCCVQQGCIEVTWQIPSFINKIIFPLSPEKEKSLEQLGVIQFSCLDYVYTAPRMNKQASVSNQPSKYDSPIDNATSNSEIQRNFASTNDHDEMATISPLYIKEVPMVFAEYIMDWMNNSNAISILVTGQTGSGKSTLINSVFGISTMPERQTLHRSKSTLLTPCESNIGSIQVTMWDSPGLGQPATDKSKAKAVEDIKMNCMDIDLCLFCVDMSNVGLTPESIDAMKTLSEIFGIDVWKNTIFILTFANKFLLRIDDDFQKNPEGKKQKFESQVGLWKKKLYTHLEKKLKLNPKIAHNAKVVPVGDHHTHKLFPDDDTRWLNELWLQAISAIGHMAKPAATKICQYLASGTKSDSIHRLPVAFTLRMQGNSETDPAHSKARLSIDKK